MRRSCDAGEQASRAASCRIARIYDHGEPREEDAGDAALTRRRAFANAPDGVPYSIELMTESVMDGIAPAARATFDMPP
ncbi:MAG: hypothetical protein IPG64_19340 [Haliea sp.]|nr:hypothetical protein [Haliea sp.]